MSGIRGAAPHRRDAPRGVRVPSVVSLLKEVNFHEKILQIVKRFTGFTVLQQTRNALS